MMLYLCVIRKLSFLSGGTRIFKYHFYSFNGATTKAETSSYFPHKTFALGNDRDSPFVTGHFGSSTCGLKTEILNYWTEFRFESPISISRINNHSDFRRNDARVFRQLIKFKPGLSSKILGEISACSAFDSPSRRISLNF